MIGTTVNNLLADRNIVIATAIANTARRSRCSHRTPAPIRIHKLSMIPVMVPNAFEQKGISLSITVEMIRNTSINIIAG